jgi:hypothetical protein
MDINWNKVVVKKSIKARRTKWKEFIYAVEAGTS